MRTSLPRFSHRVYNHRAPSREENTWDCERGGIHCVPHYDRKGHRYKVWSGSPPVFQALSDKVNLQRCSKVGFTVETHFFFPWKNHLLYCKISKLLVKGKIVNIL